MLIHKRYQVVAFKQVKNIYTRPVTKLQAIQSKEKLEGMLSGLTKNGMTLRIPKFKIERVREE